MPNIVIVYHSGYGHTKTIAEDVFAGASSVAGVSVKLHPTSDFPNAGPDRKMPESWAILAQADCIIFGSPTYMGNVSAEFKRFIDAAGGIWFAQGWKDKFAAGLTNSGGMSGDKLNTLVSLSLFAAQHSMIWISQGLMSSGTTNRLGSYLGAMAQSGNGPAPDSVNADDRASAKLFGARVAGVVAKLVK